MLVKEIRCSEGNVKITCKSEQTGCRIRWSHLTFSTRNRILSNLKSLWLTISWSPVTSSRAVTWYLSPGVAELCFVCVCSTRALGHVKQTLIDALRQVHQRSSFFEIVLVGSVSQLSGVFTDSAGSIALARRDGRLSKTNRRRKRSDLQTKTSLRTKSIAKGRCCQRSWKARTTRLELKSTWSSRNEKRPPSVTNDWAIWLDRRCNFIIDIPVNRFKHITRVVAR